MKKKGILATAMAFAMMGGSMMQGNAFSGEDFTMPSGARTKHYPSRSIQLTPKQKRRRKLNKIGRKSRKLNFKTR